MKLTRPTSLRGRVTAGVLALLAVLLVVLFVLVDLVLGSRLQADLRTRLSDRATLAAQLDPTLSAQQLVDQLRGSGIVAQLCTDGSGCVVADPAPAPPGELSPAPGPRAKPARATGPKRTAAPVQQDGNVLYVRTTLASGRQLTLSIDASAVSSALSRLIVLQTVGGLATLLLAWLLLGWVIGTALEPLDRMTSLASAIAGGQRGRRLGTGEPSTELGRTAHAFDAMLDELESALATARDAETTMRGFLSDASHELRTPLAGVQATAENLLRSDPRRAEREAALAALLGESARAGRLVDDLLTASRGAAGLSLRLETTDLGALVDHEVQRYRMLAPDLTWEQSPPTRDGDGIVVPVVVAADPQRLGQVLSNLLENAHRATPAGGRVTITVSSGANVVTAEVSDTGPGIPARDLERIFERFVRLDPSRSRRSGGAGLGLSIARTIAAAHGGTLTALPGRRPISAHAAPRSDRPACLSLSGRHRRARRRVRDRARRGIISSSHASPHRRARSPRRSRVTSRSTKDTGGPRYGARVRCPGLIAAAGGSLLGWCDPRTAAATPAHDRLRDGAARQVLSRLRAGPRCLYRRGPTAVLGSVRRRAPVQRPRVTSCPGAPGALAGVYWLV